MIRTTLMASVAALGLATSAMAQDSTEACFVANSQCRLPKAVSFTIGGMAKITVASTAGGYEIPKKATAGKR